MDAEDYQRHVAMNDICGRRGGLWGEGEWTNLEDQQWTKWLEKVSEGSCRLAERSKWESDWHCS